MKYWEQDHLRLMLNVWPVENCNDNEGNHPTMCYLRIDRAQAKRIYKVMHLCDRFNLGRV